MNYLTRPGTPSPFRGCCQRGSCSCRSRSRGRRRWSTRGGRRRPACGGGCWEQGASCPCTRSPIMEMRQDGKLGGHADTTSNRGNLLCKGYQKNIRNTIKRRRTPRTLMFRSESNDLSLQNVRELLQILRVKSLESPWS